MSSIPFRFKLGTIAAAAGLALTAANADAHLILLGDADISGSGLGNVNTLLTITSPGSTTTEAGAVGLTTTGTQSVTGDTVGINQTRTLAQIGTTNAANLRIVFNASEPASASSVTLANLVLTLQPATGATTATQNFSSGTFTPVTFNSTLQGIGNAGFVFGLDATQSAQAQAAINAGASVVGLSASATNATGGPETFFVTTAGALPPLVGAVPEPGTMALIASGVLALGGIARRRRRA